MGLLNKILGGGKTPQAACREKMKAFSDFVTGEEFWSYNEDPLRGVIFDAVQENVVLTGYYKFSYSDKVNLYTALKEKQKTKRVGSYLERNQTVNQALDNYIAENSCFAKLYGYMDILSCEIIENEEIVNEIKKSSIDAFLPGQMVTLGGDLKYKDYEVIPDAVRVRIVAKGSPNQKFYIGFSKYEQDEGSDKARETAQQVFEKVKALIIKADVEEFGE